jgi:hypothetical protein
MGKASLVGPDYVTSTQIMEALDAASLGIKVAVWMHPDEYNDWRLFLASPRLDKAHRDPTSSEFEVVHDAFEKAGIPPEDWPSLMIRPMSDRTVKEFRKRYAKFPLAEGWRIGPQSFGDRFIDDGVIYRVR